MSGETTQAIDQKALWGGGRSPFSLSYGKVFMWFFLVSDALTFGALLTALLFHRHRFAEVWPKSENVFYHFPFCGDTHLPLLYVAMMTFILIISSVTMVLAVEAGHRMNKNKVVLWLALTICGGFFFLFSQVWEWSHYIHGTHNGAVQLADGTIAQYADHDKTALLLPQKDGLGNHIKVTGVAARDLMETGKKVFGANLTVNEYGPTQYANFFFFVTGFHGFHVFSGVVINIIILLLVIKGVMHRRGHYEMVEKTGLYWHFVDLVWVFVFTFYYLI